MWCLRYFVVGLYWFFGFCWSVIVAILVVLVVGCGLWGALDWTVMVVAGVVGCRLGTLVLDVLQINGVVIWNSLA